MLLEQIGICFTVQPSDQPEILPHPMSPSDGALWLARQKAEAVADEYTDGVVLAADTVVSIDGTTLGKPETTDEARIMLETLSGRTHSVYTGLAAISVADGRCRGVAESTNVTMQDLDSALIDGYIATGEPMDKAGAYGIQGFGAVLVRRISGCYFNVVGLPISRLREVLGVTAD